MRLALGLQRAHSAVRDRRLDDALELLNTLNRDHPRRKDVCYMLGVVHRRLSRFDQAFEYLQQAEELGWPLSDVTRQRYLARFQAGEIEATQGYLYTLLQGGVDDVVAEEIYETLAQGYLSEARFRDAIVVLNHWIEWRPTAIQPRLWRANLHELFEEDWEASAKQYRAILATDEDHLEAHLSLAYALFKSQKVEEAKAEYVAILQTLPDQPLALLGLARCQQRLGKSSEAVKLYESLTSADIAPADRAEAWAALGKIALTNSEPERAVECFRAALEEDPQQVQTHHLLGTTYSRLGQEDKAQHHLALSQEMLATNQRISEVADQVANDAKNLAARMEMAELLVKTGDKHAAMRWLQTVIHIDPLHSEARDTLAKLFAEAGVHDVAAGHRRFVEQADTVETPPAPTE